MQNFRNILFVSHGLGDDTTTLQQAQALAARHGAALHVLVVYPGLPAKMEAHRESYEAALAAPLKAVIGDSTPITVEGGRAPAQRIIQRVLRDGHELVLARASAPEGGKGFKAMEMELLRKCPCPVWLCRAESGPAAHIAVAVEPVSDEKVGHELSLRLLRLGATLAAENGAKLTVVSCWDFPFESYLRHNAFAPMPAAQVEQYLKESEDEQRAALEALIAESGIAAGYTVDFRRGHAADIIPRAVAENGVGLLVMGTVARTGIPGFTIGNTAENVLQKIGCGLLALKPAGFASPVKAY